MLSAYALSIFSGILFLFVSREDLRVFPIYFFTGGAQRLTSIFHPFFSIFVYILFSVQRSSKKLLTFPQGDAV